MLMKVKWRRQETELGRQRQEFNAEPSLSQPNTGLPGKDSHVRQTWPDPRTPTLLSHGLGADCNNHGLALITKGRALASGSQLPVLPNEWEVPLKGCAPTPRAATEASVWPPQGQHELLPSTVISDKVMAFSQVPLLLPSVGESKPKDQPRFRGMRLHKDLDTRTHSSLRVYTVSIYTGNTDRSTLTFAGSEALALIGVAIPSNYLCYRLYLCPISNQ